MRGLRQASTPLSAARAFLAGAAILAGAATTSVSARAQEAGTRDSSARGANDDTALAVPRFRTGGDGVALPRPLEAAAAARLRAAFRNPDAPLDALLASPLPASLVGHVLADRLLAADARPALDALGDWLARYADLPDAPLVHAALAARLPRAATSPAPPILPTIDVPPPGDDIEIPRAGPPRHVALDNAVSAALRTGRTADALALITRARRIDAVSAALLKAEVARTLFGQGRDRDALALAEAADRQARGAVPLAPWIGGLAAWRLGRPELARTWFEATWRASDASSARRAAAAFWAARATLVTRGTRGPWLHRAAREPRTFYGLLARHMLGEPVLAPAIPGTLAEADVDAIAGTPRGQRAFALLQVGQPARATAELLLLWAETRDTPGFPRSVMLVAQAAGLTELAARIDAVLAPASARLPAARLRPRGGFKVDPALVYAVTRLESNFDPAAISPAGARGLMQLMPGTAQFLLLGTGRKAALHDPAVNLELGQRYIQRLGTYDSIGTDLVRILAAYNAGVGSFARWTAAMGPQDDPLLFIEALPNAETRAYIPRVLAYSWLYAAQLNLPSSSLDDLAAGRWPTLPGLQSWRDAAATLH